MRNLRINVRIKLLSFFVGLALLGVCVGSYIYKTSAQAGPAPQCTCRYPNGEYGVQKPIDPPVDGSRYTCVVKNCWLPVGGGFVPLQNDH